MRRKLLLLILLLLAFGTYANSAGGEYVKVTVNGKAVQPGQIIDGSTMLPLRAIAEALGAYVEWDGKTRTAKIKTQEIIVPPEAQPNLSLAELNEIGKSVPIIFAIDKDGKYFSQGSGFVIGDLIITNHHVIDGAVSLDVRFGGKYHLIPAVLAFDNPEADIAAFRLPGYPSLKLSKKEPKKGDKVYVLGHPDTKFTLSEGTIQSINNFDYSSIWSNADTEPGSSGGVMINTSGEVIGIILGGIGTYSNALHVKHISEEIQNHSIR